MVQVVIKVNKEIIKTHPMLLYHISVLKTAIGEAKKID